jgi:hypothetical protein
LLNGKDQQAETLILKRWERYVFSIRSFPPCNWGSRRTLPTHGEQSTQLETSQASSTTPPCGKRNDLPAISFSQPETGLHLGDVQRPKDAFENKYLRSNLIVNPAKNRIFVYF